MDQLKMRLEITRDAYPFQGQEAAGAGAPVCEKTLEVVFSEVDRLCTVAELVIIPL
jgi:hypothetical protein